MLKILQKGWRSGSTFMAILGILLLPKDLADSPDAAAQWWRLFGKIDQATALWVVAVCLGLYVLWIDTRPFILKIIEARRGTSLQVETCCISSHLRPDGEGRPLPFRVRCFIVVKNSRTDGKTIRGVSVSIGFFGPNKTLFCLDGDQAAVDIRAGEYKLFEFGRMISAQIPRGGLEGLEDADENEKSEIRHYLESEHVLFRLRNGQGYQAIGFMAGYEAEECLVDVTVSADDQNSQHYQLNLQPRKLPETQDAFQIKKSE